MSNHQKYLEIGLIKIHGPRYSNKKCSIFEGLAELFKCETSNDAVIYLKNEWRLAGKKKNLDIDAESDFVSIFVPKTQIIDLAILINKLAGINIDNNTISLAKKEIKNWKSPDAFQWKSGDIFYTKLTGTKTIYGHVLDDAQGIPTCALYSYFTEAPGNSIDEIVNSQAITILHVSDEHLNDQSWIVIGNRESSLDISSAPCGISGEIGSLHWDGLEIMARAWHGLEPWNKYYKDNFLDEKLLNGVERPSNAVILKRSELEKLGVKRSEWD